MEFLSKRAPFGIHKRLGNTVLEMISDQNYLIYLKKHYPTWTTSPFYKKLIDEHYLEKDGITINPNLNLVVVKKKDFEISISTKKIELEKKSSGVCFLCLEENIHLQNKIWAFIPCGHSFCWNCGEKESEKLNSFVSCPICKRPLNLFHKIQKIFL